MPSARDTFARLDAPTHRAERSRPAGRRHRDAVVTHEEVRAACASQRGAVETYPFGPETAVYKVGGKMFAVIPRGAEPPRVTLKCDPEWSEVLRQAYAAVTPGYHTNKKHWNTIVLDGSVPDDEVDELIRHSYELVADSLPKRIRAEL
jgi:predicted DNA-binding protein (MmcQ/YjbR family)